MSKYNDHLIGLQSHAAYAIGWEAFELGLGKDKNPYVLLTFREAWEWGWESARTHHQAEPDIE